VEQSKRPIFLRDMQRYLQKDASTLPEAMLRWAARSWFTVFFVGQLIFTAYILILYGGSALAGRFDRWNMASPNLYIKGSPARNTIFGLHVAIAAVVSLLGPLQVIPGLRRHIPRFHRISGRVYIFFAFAIGLDGILLAWRPGAVGGKLDHAIISLNALIIMVCALFAIRAARKRDIPSHNRWAVHLLLAMSGVWLFRVFLLLWLMIWQRPVGFDPDSFTGPFLVVLSLLVYIFPQVVTWGYFKVRMNQTAGMKLPFSLLLFLVAISMALGVFAATMGIWLPAMTT
jgi:predicted membrane protein DUF2306